jgi:hypothetical protein
VLQDLWLCLCGAGKFVDFVLLMFWNLQVPVVILTKAPVVVWNHLSHTNIHTLSGFWGNIHYRILHIVLFIR